jgi:biopolymer transport protein ExbD
MRIRRTSPEPRVEMTPLIDVVFLLLTFFVFSMALLVRAEVLDLKLPQITGGEAPGEVVTVAVDAEGRLFVDGEEASLDDLPSRAGDRLQEREGAVIMIAVDEEADAGVVLRVIDRLRAAGISDFGILTRPGQGPEETPRGGDRRP